MELLLYSENCVLRRLGDSEFDYGLGWNLDLLLRFGIEARARFPLLLHQLAEAGQDKFAVLFARRRSGLLVRSNRSLPCVAPHRTSASGSVSLRPFALAALPASTRRPPGGHSIR